MTATEYMNLECWATDQYVIDTINPDTGLTHIYHRSQAEVLEEYPDAVKTTVEDHCQEKGKRQDSLVVWQETTEANYNEMLNVLPPVCYSNRGFLVGEPWDHHAISGQPRYSAYIRRQDRFFTSSRPMTVREFNQPNNHKRKALR